MERIGKLLGILAIAFTFAYVVGMWRNSIKPIKVKTHGRKAMSFFRYGLDYLCRILLLADKMTKQFEEILDIFITRLLPNHAGLQRLLTFMSCTERKST